MPKEKLTKKFLGIIGVDSGQILLCDPCYIDSEWEHEETDLETPEKLKKHEGKFSYNGCCQATLMKKNSTEQLNYKLGHAGVGIVFASGYGDGSYKVYGFFNKEGRCMKVEIDMN